jgi:GNAT superfamily N-acetyltransferase
VVTLDEASSLTEDRGEVEQLIDTSVLHAYRDFSNQRGDFPCLFYLFDGESGVCSYFRVIPDEIFIEGQGYPWAWTCDNFTVPELRGRGLSTYLQTLATQVLHDAGIGRGSVSSTDVTLHIFGKLGFRVAGYAKRHLLVRSPDPILRGHLHKAWVRRFISKFANPCADAMGFFVRSWNRSRLGSTLCEQVSVPSNEEFQVLIGQTVGQREIRFRSDITFLGKKIDLTPRIASHSAYLIRDANGQATASMIIRDQYQAEPLAERYSDFRRMTLMHHATLRNDPTTASALVGHLVDLFYQSGADVLDLVSNDPVLNRVASRSGLFAVGKGMSFAYSVPQAWHWPPVTEDFRKWPITCMCGDAYLF